MTEQPTRDQYQWAYDRVMSWPRQPGDPYARLVEAVIDAGGFNMEPNPLSLATLRVFLGTEYANALDARPTDA